MFYWVTEWFTDTRGLVLKIDPESGKLLDSLHDPTGRISGITTAIEDGKGYLLLGADTNYYLGRVKI
ncbi:hypothetical protein WR25_12737 [Diploscapter pachys]|uniref:Adipocyte plasma membrane-associated protein n=1 Tax=Diploscapter pachys TaxID=2018661 RepID=A0A2A2JV48_9BILA|nr:hypothetical protein WR25_12737 [Diploscapter pachys]